jgi:hypothetical protein
MRKKEWEYDQKVYVAFVEQENAYDRIPHGLLWGTARVRGGW